MKFGGQKHSSSPYLGLLRDLPTSKVTRIAARLSDGEHVEDVARGENVLAGVVELIQKQAPRPYAREKIAEIIAGLSVEQLHRIRTAIEIGTPANRIAEAEGLYPNLIQEIAARSARHERRREKRLQDTVGTDG